MAATTGLEIPAELVRRMDEAIARYPQEHRRSAVMPLLHLWQEHFGFIGDDAIFWIAKKLDLQPIHILEVVTFYPMFRQRPPGKTHIRICRTLSCAMAGGCEVMDNLCLNLGIQRPSDGEEMHNPVGVSDDGNYSVEFVECLASCHTAPVCMVGEELHEKINPQAAGDLVGNVKAQVGNRGLTWPPHRLEHRLVYKNIGRPGWRSDMECYLGDGGYEQLKQALTLSREDIVNKVKNSGLRGRGGAGFSCGLKWSFIKPDEKRPVYLICNADESEPGTFKDRYIIHEDPHQLLEGMLISCYALNVHNAYIYIRGEFPEGAKILERAIAEARQRNFLGKNILGSGFDVEFYIHRGAGAYICGEETGLIESLEGKRGYPRIKPPYFPAVLGLYMCPTIVNNVETLCNIKHIIAMGGAEYARLGKPNNTGTRVLCVSGDVQRPGYFEVEVGAVTMGQLIYQMAGGLGPGRKLKAVIPGGSSAKVLRADERFKLKERQADGSTKEREISIDDIPMDRAA
jgi:NADH:ubiquinone oxidoreductase subunit F (NADH-binding)/NADH:ubiquinone oxidoreductase subunit E